jgi:hypothetical protein
MFWSRQPSDFSSDESFHCKIYLPVAPAFINARFPVKADSFHLYYDPDLKADIYQTFVHVSGQHFIVDSCEDLQLLIHPTPIVPPTEST